MNQRLSEQAQRKKATRKKTKTIKLLTPDVELFLRWLVYKRVNVSEFTRELWKSTPEFEEFKKIKDKSWLENDG